jgi:SET domain-containing protein
MKKDVLVKKSKIHGKGVFANRNFTKGEVVLQWKPKILRKSDIKKLSARQKHYIYQVSEDKYFLMQPPEKYVNHSCDANTKVKNYSDVAARAIKKGEEITSNYIKEGSFSSFICKCESKKCKGLIKIKSK